MLKILFIRSNPVAPDPRVEKEVNALHENGNNLSVLAWDRYGKCPDFEDKISYKIRRVKIKSSYGTITFIPKLFIWMIYEFFYLFKTDYDVFHACDLDTLIPAVLVSKIMNKNLVYDSFDFYADSFLPEGTPSILRRFLGDVEIFFSKFADFVILADESRIKQFKNSLKNTVIINNSPMDLKNEIKPYKESKKFTIFYAGLIFKDRGINKILEAVKFIPNVELVIAGYEVGNGTIVQELKKAANVNFLGRIDYKEVIEHSLSCDLLFALYDPDVPNNKYASPNKLFESMMCGKPIIVNENTRMAEIVLEENCGITVPYEDTEILKETIIKLKDDPELSKKLGKNGRKAYECKYGWNVMEKRLVEAYKVMDPDLVIG